MRLSAAEAQRLGIFPGRTPRKKRRAPHRPEGYPPDTPNNHVWQREGRGMRCQCGMWLALDRLPLFGHGQWEVARSKETSP